VRRFQGIAASSGIAIGPLFRIRTQPAPVPEHRVEDTAAERRRLQNALDKATAELAMVKARAETETGAEAAAMFDAQAAMLSDPELLNLCWNDLENNRLNAEAVWRDATEHFASRLETLTDEYLRARAADVRDMARRVLRVLAGGSPTMGGPEQPSIIIATDLAPSETIMLDKNRVLGFCTAGGGETSHTAILARGLGLPAVVGVGTPLLDLQDGTTAILNGREGTLIADPDASQLTEWEKTKRLGNARYAEALEHCREPAVTLDGRNVEVVANIGGLDDARRSRDQGAEGVGLFRTEFLYLQRSGLPSEDEQCTAYSGILEVFRNLPVVLRTLDIGGDKSIPYLNLEQESNPFLGVRGLRLCLQRPELFKPQLRAALRASPGHRLRIMFPMVTSPEEVRAARAMVEECRSELIRQGVEIGDSIKIGIMVEVPSAALLAVHIAPLVDFFSIGTNDLTQYTMAADRTNANLAHLASALSPAVLGLIDGVIRAAHQHQKWVGVCGELAGNPLAIPLLLGLDLDEFSMNPQAIPIAKQILRQLDTKECRSLASQALQLEDAVAVENLVRGAVPAVG
jgi:phosphoenolpyruvate-protein phosphotransferase